jgi:hypothetical protein
MSAYDSTFTLNNFTADSRTGALTKNDDITKSYFLEPGVLHVTSTWAEVCGAAASARVGTEASADCTRTARFTTASKKTIAEFGKVDFDASSSVDTGGKISRYEWDFGDGSNATTGQPNVSYEYVSDVAELQASMNFVNEHGQRSNVASQKLDLCPREGIGVTLPAVDISYNDMAKILRIGYTALPLTFRSVPPPPGGMCSFAATGSLPVVIGLGPRAFDVPIRLSSVATARLDFLRASPSSKPHCRFATPYRGRSIANNCIVGGRGDVLVRWHTDGFSERLRGVEVYNSGPLTYYALVSKSMTFSQAIRTVEPMLHVELTRHLGWIKPFYAIQEPPARMIVTDSEGETTGVTRSGVRRKQIPESLFVSNGHGYSAVILLDAEQRRYKIRAHGKAGQRFDVTLTKVYPMRSARGYTPEGREKGKLPKRGYRDIVCGPQSCR